VSLGSVKGFVRRFLDDPAIAENITPPRGCCQVCAASMNGGGPRISMPPFFFAALMVFILFFHGTSIP